MKKSNEKIFFITYNFNRTIWWFHVLFFKSYTVECAILCYILTSLIWVVSSKSGTKAVKMAEVEKVSYYWMKLLIVLGSTSIEINL